jgi:hypothetical protein
MERGSITFLLRVDYTRFESLSPAEIENLTQSVVGDHAHFDVLDHSTLTTLGLQYGLSDHLELGVLFGYYGATDVGEGQEHGGAYEFHDFGDISGLADTWIAAKLRVRSAPSGDVALIGGIKAPTGEDDIVIDGERIDQSLQPGSGSWDASLALAYTRDLGQRCVLDASAQYVLRTQAHAYRIGDQANVGLALSFLISSDPYGTRSAWGFVEVSLREQAENEQEGQPHINSGGTTVFVTPGLRADVGAGVGASVGLQWPVIQSLNDVQQELEYKMTGALTISF